MKILKTNLPCKKGSMAGINAFVAKKPINVAGKAIEGIAKELEFKISII